MESPRGVGQRVMRIFPFIDWFTVGDEEDDRPIQLVSICFELHSIPFNHFPEQPEGRAVTSTALRPHHREVFDGGDVRQRQQFGRMV